eukprot:scaffold53_cov193-Pinguiococcus_pyrenoidosus.AAC.10
MGTSKKKSELSHAGAKTHEFGCHNDAFDTFGVARSWVESAEITPTPPTPVSDHPMMSRTDELAAGRRWLGLATNIVVCLQDFHWLDVESIASRGRMEGFGYTPAVPHLQYDRIFLDSYDKGKRGHGSVSEDEQGQPHRLQNWRQLVSNGFIS